MIVFDSTNHTGSLQISEGKYVLLNPELLVETLKGSNSLYELTMNPPLIVSELAGLYESIGK